MEIPGKEEIIMTDNDGKNKNNIEEIILYNNCQNSDSSCCTWVTLIILSIIFLPIGIIFLFAPSKKYAIIDEINKILIIREEGVIPCCCRCYERIYYFNTIKKVVIYITSQRDRKVGFKKLLFMNCELVSTDGQKEDVFIWIKYDEHRLNEIQTFFKGYFETEFRPESTEMDNNLTQEENQPIGINSNDDNNIRSKPSMNEEAASPIIS